VGRCREERTIETIKTVQPHGALIVLRLPEWVITHASESLHPIFGAEAETVIGRPLSELMSRHTIHRLRNIMQFVVANGEPERLMNLAMGFKRERFDLSLYADQNRAIIEIKPRQAGQKGVEDAFFLLRAMRARIRDVTSAADVCHRTARQCRSLTGYDRATIFRFREDGTSEIVADERRDGISEAGIFYGVEETDMLARNLVKGKRFSYVPDMAYVPSRIIPGPTPLGAMHGLNAPGLDTLAPAHADYLRRSGIGAVFALPIGALEAPWGVVVCQNAEPRFIPFEIRSALEFFTNGIALQIALLGAAETFGTHATARKVRGDVLADPAMEIDPEENLQGFADALSRHIKIDGVGYWFGQAFDAVGEAPPLEGATKIAAALDAATPVVQIFDDLGAVGGLIDGEAGPGGMLAVRLSRHPSQYLMLFRRALPRSTKWGRPLEAGVSPREDIELGRSQSWSRVEIEVGHSLRSLLLDLRLRRLDRDDEEQLAALRRQETLITELNHRVKNLLALFQSLVAKTGEASPTLEEFVQTLAGRVRSLALAHDQMNGDGISNVPIRALVEAELAPYMSRDSEIILDGPELAFTSQAFAVFALVVHELATNAAKYGALSRAAGKLTVRWSRTESGAVRFVWQERGATPISPPGRRGFGSTLVERMIPFELRGEAQVNYPPEGLSALFEIPGKFVETRHADFAPPRRQAGPHRAFNPGRNLRALVVEDNMIIALQAEDMLRRLGFTQVEVAGRWQDAAGFIDANAFDVVALDVNLGGETSFPLADKLVATGTPFFFATGYGEKGTIPDRFLHVPIVVKPYSDASLSAALSEFFGASD
jgi:light-regulated signal transduction histidine kinase (bacteriophytochrome)